MRAFLFVTLFAIILALTYADITVTITPYDRAVFFEIDNLTQFTENIVFELPEAVSNVTAKGLDVESAYTVSTVAGTSTLADGLNAVTIEANKVTIAFDNTPKDADGTAIVADNDSIQTTVKGLIVFDQVVSVTSVVFTITEGKAAAVTQTATFTPNVLASNLLINYDTVDDTPAARTISKITFDNVIALPSSQIIISFNSLALDSVVYPITLSTDEPVASCSIGDNIFTPTVVSSNLALVPTTPVDAADKIEIICTGITVTATDATVFDNDLSYYVKAQQGNADIVVVNPSKGSSGNSAVSASALFALIAVFVAIMF